MLPDQSGPNPHLLIAAGKEGKIYVLNRDNLGGFDPSTDNVVQELPQAITSAFDTPAYFNGQVYFGSVGDRLKAFALADGMLSSSPTLAEAAWCSVIPGRRRASPPTAPPTASSGSCRTAARPCSAPMRPSNLATELYDSEQAGSRDQLGKAVKFAVPTVINGKVYVGTQSGLTVFGLLPAEHRRLRSARTALSSLRPTRICLAGCRSLRDWRTGATC